LIILEVLDAFYTYPERRQPVPVSPIGAFASFPVQRDETLPCDQKKLSLKPSATGQARSQRPVQAAPAALARSLFTDVTLLPPEAGNNVLSEDASSVREHQP
jgi:hypothetical protein